MGSPHPSLNQGKIPKSHGIERVKQYGTQTEKLESMIKLNEDDLTL